MYGSIGSEIKNRSKINQDGIEYKQSLYVVLETGTCAIKLKVVIKFLVLLIFVQIGLAVGDIELVRRNAEIKLLSLQVTNISFNWNIGV